MSRDCCLTVSSDHQILEWVDIPFFKDLPDPGIDHQILEWVDIPFFKDLPDPGIESGSPELQVDSLPSEPPGKP